MLPIRHEALGLIHRTTKHGGAHLQIPALQMWRQGHYKFKVILDCLVNSRPAWNTWESWRRDRVVASSFQLGLERQSLPGAAQNSSVFEVSGSSTVSKQGLWEVDKDISAWGQERSGIRVGVKRMEGFREVGMGTMNES